MTFNAGAWNVQDQALNLGTYVRADGVGVSTNLAGLHLQRCDNISWTNRGGQANAGTFTMCMVPTAGPATARARATPAPVGRCAITEAMYTTNPLLIDNVTVANMGNHRLGTGTSSLLTQSGAVIVRAANVTIRGGRIENNTRHGIYVGCDSATSATFCATGFVLDGTTVSGHRSDLDGQYAAAIEAPGAIVTGNTTFSDNTNGLYVVPHVYVPCTKMVFSVEKQVECFSCCIFRLPRSSSQSASFKCTCFTVPLSETLTHSLMLAILKVRFCRWRWGKHRPAVPRWQR